MVIPFITKDIREWSIVAIRNACKDTPENQIIIDNLRVQQSASNPELDELGLKAEIVNGKIKIIKSGTVMEI
jgi:hypothetical protein